MGVGEVWAKDEEPQAANPRTKREKSRERNMPQISEGHGVQQVKVNMLNKYMIM